MLEIQLLPDSIFLFELPEQPFTVIKTINLNNDPTQQAIYYSLYFHQFKNGEIFLIYTRPELRNLCKKKIDTTNQFGGRIDKK